MGKPTSMLFVDLFWRRIGSDSFTKSLAHSWAKATPGCIVAGSCCWSCATRSRHWPRRRIWCELESGAREPMARGSIARWAHEINHAFFWSAIGAMPCQW